jgi:hypothetical protein
VTAVRLRRGLALLLLGLFVAISGSLLPYFLRNFQLQQYMENLTQPGQIDSGSREAIRAQVVDRARELGIPVQASDVQVDVAGPTVRIAARYVVEVRWPGYRVKLHFSPSAGR